MWASRRTDPSERGRPERASSGSWGWPSSWRRRRWRSSPTQPGVPASGLGPVDPPRDRPRLPQRLEGGGTWAGSGRLRPSRACPLPTAVSCRDDGLTDPRGPGRHTSLRVNWVYLALPEPGDLHDRLRVFCPDARLWPRSSIFACSPHRAEALPHPARGPRGRGLRRPGVEGPAGVPGLQALARLAGLRRSLRGRDDAQVELLHLHGANLPDGDRGHLRPQLPPQGAGRGGHQARRVRAVVRHPPADPRAQAPAGLRGLRRACLWKGAAFFSISSESVNALGVPFFIMGWFGVMIPDCQRAERRWWVIPGWLIFAYLIWGRGAQPADALPPARPRPSGRGLGMAAWPKAVVWSLAALQVVLALNFSTGWIAPVKVQLPFEKWVPFLPSSCSRATPAAR